MAITRLGGANAITGTIPNSVLAAGNVIQVVSTEMLLQQLQLHFYDVTGSSSITPQSTQVKYFIEFRLLEICRSS